MSTSEQDPLETLFRGESASPESLELLDAKAWELLSTQSGMLEREFGYLADDGSLVLIRTHVDEEELLPGSVVELIVAHFADEEAKIIVPYGLDNSLCHVKNRNDDDLTAAFFLAEMVKTQGDIPDLDNRALAIISHLQRIISIALGGEVDETVPSNGTHVADLARQLVEEHNPTTVRTVECGKLFDDNRSIKIIGRQLLGHVDFDGSSLEDLPELEIIYEDTAGKTEYYYTKSMEGKRELTFAKPDSDGCEEVGELVGDESLWLGEIEDMAQEVWDATPGKDNVELLMTQMALVQTQETDG